MESFEKTDVADLGGSGLMQTSSKVTRRTVVATGVAAAWSIPLIQLATAAPALAVSGSPLSISGTGQWAGKNSQTLNTTFSVANSRKTSFTGLVVTYTFPNGKSDHWAPTAAALADWDVKADGYTITFTAKTDLGSTGLVAAPVITATQPSNFGKAVTISLIAAAGGYTATGAIVVPKG